MAKFFLLCGSSLAFLSVAMGAFGAHALQDRVSLKDLEVFKTAAHYQIVHSLALLCVGFLLPYFSPASAIKAAGLCFLIGTLVFSGSLYTLVLTQTRWLGAVTPIGGVGFLAGWALFFYAVLFHFKK
jgi:uncharacterized membrane protein YgdD (TMEM256/DUF423 family)